MNDQIPERAILIINTLIGVYNNEGLEDKNIAAHKTIKFLSDRIDTVRDELNLIEFSEENFKRNNKVGSLTEEANMFQTQALSVDNKKIEQIGQLQQLETLENYIENSKGTPEIIPSTLSIAEPTLFGLINSHNLLVQQKQAMAIKSQEADPKVIELTEQIKDVRQNLLKNMGLLKTGFQKSINQISNNYSSLESKIASLPEKERRLINIKRQLNLKENLYLYLLQKREETELSLASNINNTRIVDGAFNTGVIKPVASQIQLFAILLGIAIPALIIILRDFFNTRLNDKKDIEEGTSVPILGELSYEKNKSSIVIDKKSRSAISEQFRLIRTNLQYMGADKPVKTFMLSSFMSGEGKSFVSLNLASSLGITGARTVILEFDLRKPKLSKYLNVPSEHGISNYIIKDIPVQDIIQKVPGHEHISVISSGPIPPNPAELILSAKTTKLFEYLRENFDVIIIDTAPVGLVTDALLLEKYVDLTMFMVRHKYSFKAVVPYIEKLNRERSLKIYPL